MANLEVAHLQGEFSESSQVLGLKIRIQMAPIKFGYSILTLYSYSMAQVCGRLVGRGIIVHDNSSIFIYQYMYLTYNEVSSYGRVVAYLAVGGLRVFAYLN